MRLTVGVYANMWMGVCKKNARLGHQDAKIIPSSLSPVTSSLLSLETPKMPAEHRSLRSRETPVSHKQPRLHQYLEDHSS